MQALRAANRSSCGLGAASVPNISSGSSAAIVKWRSIVLPLPSRIGRAEPSLRICPVHAAMPEIAAPEVEFLDAEIVACAGFVRGQQADRDGEHDFGLAPGDPA